MLSELIISVTLLINAAAVLNFKLDKAHDAHHFVVEGEVKSIGDKIREFLLAVRYFRVFIAVWNVFLVFLMLVFFSH